MKKLSLLLVLLCLLLASCSTGTGGESSVTPAISSDIVDSSERSIDYVSNVGNNNDEDYFDGEPSVPIYWPTYNYSYEDFFAELDDDNLKPLKFEHLKGVFDILQIICDPYYKGYYVIDSKTDDISIFTGKVEDSAKGVINRLIESGLAESNREYNIFSNYEELDKYRDASGALKIHCMNYKKEGVNVYALQTGPNSKAKYTIYFVIDGQLFGVSSPGYTYPNRYTAINAGGLEQEYVYCKPRAKDEWGDFDNVNEALIELSDVTTESSALMRALKKAVADAK